MSGPVNGLFIARDRAGSATPPGDAFARGRSHASRHEWGAAVQAFRHATAERPGDVLPWINLAHACLHAHRPDEGVDAARAALRLEPANALALDIAAQILSPACRDRELAELCDAFEMSGIADARLHLQHGQALARLWRHQDAVAALFEALRRDPALLDAHIELAAEFQQLRMHEEARECFRTAAALSRHNVPFLSAVVFASLSACSWATLDEDLARMRASVAAGNGHPEPFYSLTLPTTRAEQRAAMESFWLRVHAERGSPGPRAGDGAPPRAGPGQGARLRVGYVSGDLHAHATAFLIAEVFELHDRERFEIFAYSYGDDDGSPMRARLRAGIGEGAFRDVRERSDADIAQAIREDGIDILVDLKGYTLRGRAGIFALRPAPIQVNYLGFPGTMGSDCHDYIIGDPVVTPLDHAEGYSECIAQLPGCYQPNDRRRAVAEPQSRARWGLPADAFVFCSFNANYKITPEVFDAWCRLLAAVPDAILWTFESNGQARRNLLAEAARRGIGAERFYWAPPLSNAEHLARIGCADLFLDTLPVNAHTTASDALWAGLPVVTVRGDTFVSRVAASLLTAAGLAELVAGDLAGYERMALELAGDRARLARLRERLGRDRLQCALFDSGRTTRGLEDLFARMAQRHRAGLAPAPLPALLPADEPAG